MTGPVSTRSPLTLYPAIDLKGGAVVRLLHGKMDDATVYNEGPSRQAAAFRDAGFHWIHIVDLDGAFSGKSENAAAIRGVLAASDLKMQLGGGVRDMRSVEHWLSLGIARVILGTAAIRDPDFVRSAARAFPDRIVVGVDALDGRVKTDGWAGETEHAPIDIGKRFEDHGVAAVVYTDISRDGALTGVNVSGTVSLADALAIPVIASGGVASIDDIAALASASENIEGVIIGRGLYDGRIEPDAALSAAKRH